MTAPAEGKGVMACGTLRRRASSRARSGAGPEVAPAGSTERVRRRLDAIRVVAIADALLLVVLVIAALSDAEGVVSVLGPIHGVGFLVLVYLCLRGAGENMWGWWFPALVVVTLGPPGSLIGDVSFERVKTSRSNISPSPGPVPPEATLPMVAPMARRTTTTGRYHRRTALRTPENPERFIG